MEESELTELLGGRGIKLENHSPGLQTGVTTMEPDLNISIMPHFDPAETDLGIIQEASDEVMMSEQLPALHDEAEEDEDTRLSDDSGEEVIVQLMDIRTRLSRLRTMLERRLATDLTNYTFWLQDAKMLEGHKTLVEQCIRGEGVVQVNLQLRAHQRRINILDVLKPDEELLHLAEHKDMNGEVLQHEEEEEDQLTLEPEVPAEPETAPEQAATKWVVDAQFRQEQKRLNIPDDPALWTVAQVRLWIQWAVRALRLRGVTLADWSMSGERLVNMTDQEFRERYPEDPGNVFWTHFELLRKCKFVAVMQPDEPEVPVEAEQPASAPSTPATSKSTFVKQSAIRKRAKLLNATRRLNQQSEELVPWEEDGAAATMYRSGNNGQVQLWQFLLELLTSADYLPLIQWIGTEGEFKLVEPERVARLWGARKHKPAMNYEKLSRALRYYYDGDMIAKVAGKRFVYKFVCDLRQLVGYDAAELSAHVREVYYQQCAGEGTTSETNTTIYHGDENIA